MRHMSLGIVVGFGLFVLTSGFERTAFGQASVEVECKSDNYKRKICSVGRDIASLRLVEKKSRASCIEGTSYGFEKNAVWVDRGCVARFEVKFVPEPKPGNNVRPGGKPKPGPVNDNRSDRPVYSQETVRLTCKSKDYKRGECAVSGDIIAVSLVENKSKTNCTKDRTYGFRNDVLWVDRGCEGVFDITFRERRNSGPDRGNPDHEVATRDITCKSKNYSREECFVGGRISNLRVRQNTSKTKCQPNVNYGFHNDAIWVDKGCAADFEVTYRPRN